MVDIALNLERVKKLLVCEWYSRAKAKAYCQESTGCGEETEIYSILLGICIGVLWGNGR